MGANFMKTYAQIPVVMDKGEGSNYNRYRWEKIC